MKKHLALSIFLVIAGVACTKNSKEEISSNSGGAAQNSGVATTSSTTDTLTTTPDDSDIELPEDYADDAAEEITAENLNAQVAAIEKEITTTQ